MFYNSILVYSEKFYIEFYKIFNRVVSDVNEQRELTPFLLKFLSKIHPQYNSPYISIIVFSIVTMLLGGLCPFNILSQLSSMGALIDYSIVIIIVILFRFTKKDVERSFRCPAIFITAPLALGASLYLLYKQVIDTTGQISICTQIILYWLAFFLFIYLVNKLYVKYLQKKNNIDF